MATRKESAEKAAEREKILDDNRVTIFIPYIEGEDKELSVSVNDKRVKIKKGRQVKVTPDVAQVIENSNQQMMKAIENQQKMKSQSMDL